MIRLAKEKDLEIIINIYNYAREYMKKTGNTTQWHENYPNKEIAINDINNNNLYVYEEDNIIHGVFTFIIGEDKTYKIIEEGSWLSNELYGTIHRLASDGKIKGLFNEVLNYCENIISHIRVDTHENNKVMQHLLLKNGFKRCGIIYVEDKTPRIAYEKI
ncbi:MAG: N-acetyltransferase [Bacilli bacterium]|nr:N-acetyltransferase [Bacilli bacterium]